MAEPKVPVPSPGEEGREGEIGDYPADRGPARKLRRFRVGPLGGPPGFSGGDHGPAVPHYMEVAHVEGVGPGDGVDQGPAGEFARIDDQRFPRRLRDEADEGRRLACVRPEHRTAEQGGHQGTPEGVPRFESPLALHESGGVVRALEARADGPPEGAVGGRRAARAGQTGLPDRHRDPVHLAAIEDFGGGAQDHPEDRRPGVRAAQHLDQGDPAGRVRVHHSPVVGDLAAALPRTPHERRSSVSNTVGDCDTLLIPLASRDPGRSGFGSLPGLSDAPLGKTEG